jgi:hypothetical protein
MPKRLMGSGFPTAPANKKQNTNFDTRFLLLADNPTGGVDIGSPKTTIYTELKPIRKQEKNWNASFDTNARIKHKLCEPK